MNNKGCMEKSMADVSSAFNCCFAMPYTTKPNLFVTKSFVTISILSR